MFGKSSEHVFILDMFWLYCRRA